MPFSADMAAALSPSYQCFFKPPPSFLGLGLGLGLGFEFQRKGRRLRRHVNLVISAQLSNSFSLSFGLDSQNLNSFQSNDPSQLSWMGPVPGDIAEVEAYCRIFRNSERLHSALMDALCNPLTGECSVSYEVPSDEKPQLEDKIVSVLGCMISLVNKGREDVLSGRSSIMNAFRAAEVSTTEDKLPPLALFRSEMKRCSESLHVALENYLIPDDDRSLNVWRKLQRLKNVCYDSGFPRREGCPCHTLFANWSPVYLSASKEDTESKDREAAFWTGGQVTEEGLKWLLDKGYKTIIDIRAENVKDNFYQEALRDAISFGRIELVKIPVEVKTAPTMEQVVRFASYVSDSSKRPIYVHSKEGVWRTSAMVSRWRHSLQESLGSTHEATAANEEGYFPSDSKNINPLKAQVPPCDIFSKREMSNFFGRRNISPPSFVNYQSRRLECSLQPRNMNITKPQGGVVVRSSDNPIPNTVVPESSNGSADVDHLSREPQVTVGGNWKLVNGSTSGSVKTTVNGFSEGEMNYITNANVSNTVKDDINVTTNFQRVEDQTVKDGLALNDDDLGSIEGDMCASTTGVVRVQSRKKAEMFLVRTDGFSCTREKVTESSLAFTHPSTQQQMLMWKSMPKNVLLLKKLGEELMEEAKMVASFLYHQEKMNVLVEPDVHDIFARIPGFGFVHTFYSQDTSDLHEKVDFVACLGGDGVILHASNLFRGAVPPIVSFNLGSLGFLTSHDFEDYKQDLRQVIHGNNTRDGVYITLRMRLRCEIFRKGKAMPGKVFDILNEVVVDRGSNPYLSKIECYEHDRLITKVQGDGVIVATPTGSTAYSTAAGGSMVHPNVPGILFTPICPHSLSFRPVILPDSAQLELKIPEDARSNAWVSFDGKRRQQLSRGDSVRISMSQHPLPTVNKFDQTGDWFRSLIRCLNWNERLDQKAL
uniref:NAD(+) kinase n=1 Tax=Cajanus cajan TaxID=3821 RepID=A0A151RCH5_CAJCA|nr:hypothetical protein KK1_038430 [Cajanus cajan]